MVWRFQFLLTPLAAAAILAYLLNPLVTWLAESMRVKRIYALLLLYGGILLIWSAGAVILGFVVADQVSRLRTVLPDLIPRLVEQVQTLSKDWSTTVVVIGPYRLSLDSIITPVEWSQIADQVRTGIQPIVSRSGVLVAEIAQATLSTLGRVLLVIVISIYISNDVPKLGAAISNIAHQPGYRYDADRLVHETLLIWNAYLRGQVLLALVIGVVVSIALTLLGVSNAIALGILSGVLEFLPIVGPVIGTVAAVLVAVFQSSNYLGLSPVDLRAHRAGRYDRHSTGGEQRPCAAYCRRRAGSASDRHHGRCDDGGVTSRSLGCDIGCSTCRHDKALRRLCLAQVAGYATVS